MERLSPPDAAFLEAEDAAWHASLAIASVAVIEGSGAGPGRVGAHDRGADPGNSPRTTEGAPGAVGSRAAGCGGRPELRPGRGLADLAGVVRPAAPSSLSGPIGQQRRYGLARASLPEDIGVGRAFGVTVNDVVLAAISTAFRKLLLHRGEQPAADTVRALVPVSVRAAGDDTLDNRISLLLPFLPVDVANPVEALSDVHARLAAAKDAGDAETGASITALAAHEPWRNELMRRADWVQAALLLAVLTLSLVLLPVALAAGSETYAAQSRISVQQSHTRHPATAVLETDAPPSGMDGSLGYTTAMVTTPVQARWQVPEGGTRVGTVSAASGLWAGEEVPIWLDRDGNAVDPPLDLGGCHRRRARSPC